MTEISLKVVFSLNFTVVVCSNVTHCLDKSYNVLGECIVDTGVILTLGQRHAQNGYWRECQLSSLLCKNKKHCCVGMRNMLDGCVGVNRSTPLARTNTRSATANSICGH